MSAKRKTLAVRTAELNKSQVDALDAVRSRGYNEQEVNDMLADVERQRNTVREKINALQQQLRGIEEVHDTLSLCRKRMKLIEGLKNQEDCSMCHLELPTVVFECGHQVMCSLCLVKLCNEGRSLKCPICRASLTEYNKVLGRNSETTPLHGVRRELFPPRDRPLTEAEILEQVRSSVDGLGPEYGASPDLEEEPGLFDHTDLPETQVVST
jgi:hypothetical protein